MIFLKMGDTETRLNTVAGVRIHTIDKVSDLRARNYKRYTSMGYGDGLERTVKALIAHHILFKIVDNNDSVGASIYLPETVSTGQANKAQFNYKHAEASKQKTKTHEIAQLFGE